jgi:hypothetical protein
MRRIAWIAAHQTVVLVAFLTFAAFVAQAENSTHRARSLQPADFAYWISDTSGRPMNFTTPSSPDNWLGGTGNWSNGADWSAGEPGSGSDVFINTGNDYVTLDTSASINSLTIGGGSGSSVLIDPNQGDYTVNIAGALTINQTGTLTLTDDSITANGNSTNAGTINLSLSTLTVNANFTNSGTVNLLNNGGFLSISGTLNNSGTIADNNMSQLKVGGDVNNSGSITVFSIMVTGNLMDEPGSMLNTAGLTVGGNLINAGDIEPLKKASSFAVDGELINSGIFDPEYATATVGSLNNSGLITLGLLTVTGDAVNSGEIQLGWCGGGCASQGFIVHGTLTNTSAGDLLLEGPYIGANAGSIVNSGKIDLQNSASLSAGNLANSGTVNVAGGSNGGSSLTVSGRFTNSPGGIFDLSQGSTATVANLINVGTVMVGNGATLTVPPGSHAPNNALAGFLNSGTVDIASGGVISSPSGYTQTAGQTTIDGNLRGVINFAGGSVYGNGGTISGNVTSNANFNIGDAPMSVGELTITAGYTQRANGSLTFDIASLNSYDQLNVSGHAQLNGLMTVNLLSGYIPQVGNMFDIMNFASESGTFSTVVGLPIDNQEHFTLEYNATNLTLDVVSGPGLQATSGHGSSSSSEPFITPLGNNMSFVSSPDSQPASSVPEPGSILLFGSGIAGVAAFVRRAGRI